MAIKLAILQVADAGPLESLVDMLGAIGIPSATCSPDLQRVLRDLGCDTVLDHRDLTRQLGYDAPMPLPEAGIADMSRNDVLYVDVKAHRNAPKVWARWPHLEKRTLWYRINGGKPEHVVNVRGDMGDEVNPPCPVLTPNQWYGHSHDSSAPCPRCGGSGGEPRVELCQNCDRCLGWGTEPYPWMEAYLACRFYACWPPFHRAGEYIRRGCSAPPVCLVHGNWGYSSLFSGMAELGIKLYGQGQPNGIIQHREVPALLSTAMAYVHLKSSDAPGYSLYEALAAGCPIICTRRLIWKCRMESLLEPGVTCLTFDREGHQGLTDEDVHACIEEVYDHLEALKEPAYNRKIGEAGKERLKLVMWNANRDGDSLREFIAGNFS